MDYFICLDVGGTNIKSAVLLDNGTILDNIINECPSLSDKSKEIIINNLCNVIKKEYDRYDKKSRLLGIGLGFPGPFDYENGICKIKDLAKYESIYDVNVREELMKNLDKEVLSNISENFAIFFENDATMYAFGETFKENTLNDGKTIAICIGTGIGSAFLNNGKLIKHDDNIPQNGWIYSTKFKDSIIDDYISARGILKIYKDLTGETLNQVKPIADKALNGDDLSIKTFETFGFNLAQALNIFIKSFNPDNLIIGGQISKSYSLFEKSFLENLDKKLNIYVSPTTSESTIIGIKNFYYREVL